MPGANPRFSILLPTHDRADTVVHAIRSALYQTRGDFELLVVCDGCTSETAGAVRSFDDERIRLFELPKAPGHGWANRNIALRQARGELIAFLGDDDLYLPDHLERFDDVFADQRVEWAYSRPLWMADDGIAVPSTVNLHRPVDFQRFVSLGNSIPAPCVVHRRSALDRYGFWPDHLWKGEGDSAIDWELWRRMVGPSDGANLAYVSVPTCIHFRARWRVSGRWANPMLIAAMQDARDGWWPAELKRDIEAGATPQAVVWGFLASDSGEWVSGVRSGVAAVVDGFAQGFVVERERASSLATRSVTLQAALDEQTRRADELAQFRASILTSRSWRVMTRARRVLRLLRRGKAGPK